MLIPMVVILVLLVTAGTLSKIYTGRAIMQLEEELFEFIEEQRKTLNQLRLAAAALKSVEARRNLAQQECAKMQNELARIQAQVKSLLGTSQWRKEQEQGSRLS